MIPINLVSEDELSELVMVKLVKYFAKKFLIANSYGGYGNGYIKRGISGFNQASTFNPFFVLTDLDSSQCPPALISNWLKQPKNPKLIFRVAVKEVESWLLADSIGASAFFGVSAARMPVHPEKLIDPKRSLIQIARHSNKRYIREDIIPKTANASIGPNYNGRLGQFIESVWDIDRAILNSQSLRKAVKNLNDFEFP